MNASERMLERWRRIHAGELPTPSRNGNGDGGYTKLTKPVIRQTAKIVQHRAVIITLAPAGSQSEALIGLRLKGKRTQYVVALSWIYTMAALQHGQKEATAKRAARKAGVKWKQAKKQFIAANSI